MFASENRVLEDFLKQEWVEDPPEGKSEDYKEEIRKYLISKYSKVSLQKGINIF